MIGTEAKLWSVMSKEVEHIRHAHFARIESPITPGCSDVHYSLLPWTGWIELKTANWPRPGKALSLHSPFTFAQAGWLLHHNDHDCHERSWLLVGIIGVRTWKQYLLLEPTQSLKLLKVREGTPIEQLLKLEGVHKLFKMSDVVKRIRSV